MMYKGHNSLLTSSTFSGQKVKEAIQRKTTIKIQNYKLDFFLQPQPKS